MMKTKMTGLAILARQNLLTEDEWFSLLEARRIILEPHLRSMSLKALGDLKIVHDDINRGAGNGRKLRLGAMAEKTLSCPPYTQYLDSAELRNIDGGRFSLETRGIFANDEIYYHGHYHWKFIREHDTLPATGQILRFWGLTRDGDWIKVECVCRYIVGPLGNARDQKRTEVQKVVISESEPQEICQFCHVTLRWLWERLGDATEAWVKHRQELLVQAETLTSIVRQENSLLSIIEPK